jgi:hypothetical protein
MFKPILLAGFLTLAACSSNPAPITTVETKPRVRASAVVDGLNLKLSVVLEGSDGNSLTGAFVTAADPGGALNPMPFSSAANAYNLGTPALAGKYKLFVDSAKVGSVSLEIPVLVLDPAPGVTLVRDASGASAQDFKKLKASQAIEVTWSGSLGAQRYLLEGRQAGKTVFSKVIPAGDPGGLTSLIPAGTFEGSLTGSTATVLVTASVLNGDAVFKTANFVSSSSVSGASFSFQVEP